MCVIVRGMTVCFNQAHCALIPGRAIWSAESVTASSIHQGGLVVGRCTPRLPGDRGNTCLAPFRTSSSRHSFVSPCLELNVGPQKSVKAALLWSFVVCTQKLEEGRDVFPLPPKPDPSLSSRPGRRDMAWMDRTQLPWSCTDHNRLIPFKQRACMKGSNKKPPNHFIKQSLCYQNKYSFTRAVEDDDFEKHWSYYYIR